MSRPPDLWDSIKRLREAVERMDDRAPAILAYHAAIERELELAIARKVPRPSSLTGLSYGHKVRIWSALQEVSDDLVERVAKPMLKFNDLRNAIAHGDNKREVDAVLGGLWASVPTEGPAGEPDLLPRDHLSLIQTVLSEQVCDVMHAALFKFLDETRPRRDIAAIRPI